MKNPAVTTAFQARTRESIEAFVEFIEQTRAELGRAGSPLPAANATDGAHGVTRPTLQIWANHFLDEIGYFTELRRQEKTPEAGDSRVRNLKDLIATLDDAAPATSPAFERLEKFLEDITLDSDREEEQESAGDAVTLITMHSCKGLEFPHVYVVGLEDGLLPHSRSKAEGTLDEERRLFYVAITRAMQTLTISHCAGRKKYGQVMPCHPSQFLKELPEELIEHGDEKGKQPVAVESGKNMFAEMRNALK
jgi:superfamily I DNA/RNA helicase